MTKPYKVELATTHILNQLQTRGRTWANYTLEREGVPSNAHQPVTKEDMATTHRTRASRYFTSSFSPTGGEMSNTASVQAT